MADYSYDEYLRVKARQEKGGGTWVVGFEEWQKSQPGYGTTQVNPGDSSIPSSTPSEGLYNPDGSSKNGRVPAQQRNADGGVSPQTFESRFLAGEFEGQEGEATQLEVRRRRKMLTEQGMKDLPPDVADIVLRDAATGNVRKARSSTTMGALGQAFSTKDSLFGDRR